MQRIARSVQVVALVGLVAAATVFGVAACSSSSAETAPPVAPDTGTGTDFPVADTGPLEPFDSGPSIPFDSGPTLTDVVVPPPFDAGPAVLLDAGPDAAPIQCVAGGFAEVEPNDTEQTATPYGTLTNPAQKTACGSASATDSDYLTFSLPVGTNTYNLDWTGAIGWTLSVNGTTIDSATAKQLPPVDTAHPYVLKVTATQAANWTMTVRSQ